MIENEEAENEGGVDPRGRGMTIKIERISITDLDTDAIVNAANEGLWAGGGVCGAIFRAAGYEQLQEACNKIGHCDAGNAVITSGFHLKAKYIIHAVGPRWIDGKHREPEYLYSAYYQSLKLAMRYDCHSIGFPLISAGIFGYPVEGAWQQAFSACSDFLDRNPGVCMQIVFAVLSDEIIKVGRKVFLESGASRYKIASRHDWKTEDMPEKNERFVLDMPFTEDQMKVLRRGHIPQEMEDKWFWYMEGNSLYVHRSWSGFCIYRVNFLTDHRVDVLVNRDPEQYTCTSNEQDALQLRKMLNRWAKGEADEPERPAKADDSAEEAGGKPDQLRIGGRTVDAFFFHKPDEAKGYLSNWYPCSFNLDSIHFSSVEQYIMFKKCILFGDHDSATKVMATEDVARQQVFGREARGYIENVWAGVRQMVVFRGLMAKFAQNEELRKRLLDTGEAYLVECAKSDKIWACGVRLDDDRRLDAANWTGKNILGFALMEVREKLREDEAQCMSARERWMLK